MTTSELAIMFVGLENVTNGTSVVNTEFGATTSLETAIITIFYGLCTIVGFIGNSMVVLVVLKEKKMRNTTNVFVFSLSIADLSFIIICVPFTALSHIFGWIFGDAWCKIMTYFTFVNVYASVYTLTVMSFDRFLAIAYPIRTMKFRRTRYAIICVVVIWLVILSALTPMLIFSAAKPDGENVNCLPDMSIRSAQLFIAQFFATSYAFPLTVISLTYFLMLRTLWINSAPSANISEESARRKRKVTFMVVVVVVVFAICWLPIHIILLLTHFAGYNYGNHVLMAIYYTANCMSYANSCINPIIYVFLSRNYRHAFKRAICCCVRKQQTSRGAYNRDSMMATTAVTNSPYKPVKRWGGGKYVPPSSQHNSVSSSSVTHSSPKPFHGKRKGNEYSMSEMSRTRGETKPLFGESSASDACSNPSEAVASEEERPLSATPLREGAIKRVARAITRAAFVDYYEDSDTSSLDTESVSTTTSSPVRRTVEFKFAAHKQVQISQQQQPTSADIQDTTEAEKDERSPTRYDVGKTDRRVRLLRRNRATFLSHHN